MRFDGACLPHPSHDAFADGYTGAIDENSLLSMGRPHSRERGVDALLIGHIAVGECAPDAFGDGLSRSCVYVENADLYALFRKRNGSGGPQP